MSPMRRLLRLYRPTLGWMLLGALLSLLALLANVGLMALSGWFITAMGLAGVAGIAINYFTPAAIIRGLAIARTAGRYGERVVTHEATFRLVAQLRSWLFDRIEPLAPADLGELHSGDLLNRVQKDVDRLDGLYLRIVLPVVVAIVALLLFAAFMSIYDITIAAAVCSLLLVGGALLPLWSMRRSTQAAAATVTHLATLRTQVVDTVQGLGELINNGAFARYQQRIADTGDRLAAVQSQLHRLNALNTAAIALLAGLAMLAVLYLGMPMVDAGTLDGRLLPMLALFALAAFEAVAPLPQVAQVWSETRAAADRVLTLADRVPSIQTPRLAMPVPPQGEIDFDHVALRYTEGGPLALEDIRLQLPVGSRTLVIGESGAGKTSLTSLLLRFVDPTEGQLRFADHDLRSFDVDAWRQRIAIVSQHHHLFNATLRDNLLLAAPDASDAQMEAACRLAQIHEFIAAQPDGYDTWLGDTGTKVSGGQARRIAIAQAVLKEAPILILDEPTEGLDSVTTRALCETLDLVMHNKTVVVISHRPLPLSGITQTIRLEAGRQLQ
ncbi:thiol reductant ABC exporter subunit CydC [Thiosocius teredinicola]|uniref:thiol reductant ABC exporter subunit CydC n=1 Tax=Thiosocius teredinicola TaxID=1973002 RepID=UPI000990BA37